MGGEQVPFIDRDENRMFPVLTRRADKAGEEGRCLDDALFGIEVGEIQMEGDAMVPRAGRCGGQAIGGDFGGLDRGGPDMRGKVAELAFGIDDHRLHIVEGFFDDAAHGLALARTGPALDQHAPGKDAVEVQFEGTVGRLADGNCAARRRWRSRQFDDVGHGAAPFGLLACLLPLPSTRHWRPDQPAASGCRLNSEAA
jgi:hypothetical protein